MAGVSSLGIGSGLSLSTLLNQLMTVERQPITQIQTQQSKIRTTISAVGSLTSTLSALQTAAKAVSDPATLSKYNTTVADTSVANVTATTAAAPGTFSLSVTSLAKANKLLSGSFGSTSALVGAGTLTLELGSVSGGAFTINPDKAAKTITLAATATLNDARDAINNSGAGISASIVNDAVGSYKLLLTSNDGGTQNVIRASGIAGLDYDPAAATGSLAVQQPAADAQFSLDGIAFTKSSNTVTDAITGLSITLNKVTTTTTTTPPITTTDTPTRITVSRDDAAAKSGVDALIKAYNDFHSGLVSATAYNATTKTGAALNGNTAARNAGATLARVVSAAPDGVTGTYQRLSDIGITLQKDGSLAMDATKYQKAVDTNRADVAALVKAVGLAVSTAVDQQIGSDGALTRHTATLNKTSSNMDKRIEALNTRMEAVQARYQAQFTALDTAVSKMNSTSAYLTTQLARL